MNTIAQQRPDLVRHQIAKLRSLFPEMEDDDTEAWLLSLQSETDMEGMLAVLLNRLNEVEALSGGLAGKIAEFESRMSRFEQQQRSIKSAMLSVMQAAGIRKHTLPTATLSVRDGIDRVQINDEASVPDTFCRIKREPDKTKIKVHLQEGSSLNWAALVRGEQSLAIRTK